MVDDNKFNQNEIINKILESMPKIKSSYELLYNIPLEFNNTCWDLILDNLIPLFIKYTFYEIYNKKKYYPQEKPNCRYYIKPNDGSCGKGITIVNSKPKYKIEGYTICPEILTPLHVIDGKKFKYDYRIWIGISSNLEYYICPTFIKRISNISFNINKIDGSLTNTSLYSEQINYTNELIYDKINNIVKDVLNHLIPIDVSKDSKNHIMLTG